MPGAENVVGDAVFVMASAGDRVAGMVSDAEAVVLPDFAVAELVMPPASTSACVEIVLAVHVIEDPGARPLPIDGQDTVAILLSATVTAEVSVTLPVLVTL